MSSPAPQIRPLLRVALPVAVAAVLVVLAIINIVLVKVWRGEPEDGVLWLKEGANVVAREIAPGTGRRARGPAARRRAAARRRSGRDRSAAGRGRAAPGGVRRSHADVRRPAGLERSAAADSAAADAGRAIEPLLLAGARRDSRGERRRVRPAATAGRSRDAALLLADGGVLRGARVHAERPLRLARLLLRLGRCGRAVRAAADVLPLRAGLPRSPERLGAHAGGPDAAAADLSSRRSCSASRGCCCSRTGCTAPAASRWLGVIETAALLYLALALVGGLGDHAARAGAPSIGDGAPAAALDRLGLVARRAAVRARLRRRRSSSAYELPGRRIHRRAPRLHSARVRLGHRPLPVDGHRGDHQEGARRDRLRAAPRRHLPRRDAGRQDPRGRRAGTARLGAADDARRRADRAVAEERDPGRARSSVLPRSLRLPPRARRLRPRSEQRSRSCSGSAPASSSASARRSASSAWRCSCRIRAARRVASSRPRRAGSTAGRCRRSSRCRCSARGSWTGRPWPWTIRCRCAASAARRRRAGATPGCSASCRACRRTSRLRCCRPGAARTASRSAART